MMAAAIECRGLRKTYDGKVEAVRGLDLEIQAGECFGLLGPNGAGKTTTIEILEGLLAPTAGQVTILGRTWQAHQRELRELLGMFASFYRRPRPAGDVMQELELTEKAESWVGKLSGGQKQRLAVATALVGNPQILFLDEPTTGLDPQSRRQLWEIVRAFQRGGGTVLLTTHYMDEAQRLCDRIAIVDHGQIIALGTPAQLISRLGGHHVVEFATSGNDGAHQKELWRALPGVDSVHEDDGMLLLNVREPHQTIPALLAAVESQGSQLVHLTTRQASLEDVFVHLTGRHLRED
jgi:ABC-2 type transport system ATP-binding protein